MIDLFHDARRNMLVYDLHDAEDTITGKVPGAVKLHNGYVAAPASLYNLQLLRFLGYPVIQPMDATYDWPGRFKPFAAQRITSNFLAVHPRAFVLSDMGTGKTLAALWAADFVMAQYPRGDCRAVIICPLSTMQRVWADAVFENFLGRRTAVVVHGSAEKRRKLLAEPHDFYIINFDGLGVGFSKQGRNAHTSLAGDLAARTDLRMAIVDEASAYRDGTTHRHLVARKLLAPRDYLWMMTGTPTPQGPTDAYGMAKLVNNAFGESYRSYHDRTMLRLSQFKWVPKSGAHVEAHKLLQPAVRFAIEDCIDLPPMTTQMRDVELSPEQRKAYDEMRKRLQIMVRSGQPITAANEAVLRGKLIQISCGAVYDATHEAHRVDPTPRVAATKEILEQSREKIIVFAPLTSVLHMLCKELKDYGVAMINGEVSPVKRSEIFRAFQEDEYPRVLVADPGTMSHGLTLTAAATIVWYGPTDRTETYLQANKRIHRPGQVNACTVVQLASTAVEREIYRRLAANETLQGALLRMAEGRD